jgi:enoyl-CoA hydratase/carnithine racemase
MSEAPVLFEIKDHIAQITLNRPNNRNATDDETMPDFSEAVRKANGDQDLRCLIITGSGSTFCSGADFKSAIVDNKGHAFPTKPSWMPTARFLRFRKSKSR